MSLLGAVAGSTKTPRAEALPSRRSSGDRSPYAQAALDAECLEVSQAAPGTRNNKLNVAALKLAQLVAGGYLTEGEVRDGLHEAGRACGLDERETRKTIASGMAAGMKEPRHPPERPTANRSQFNEPPPVDDWMPLDESAPDAPPTDVAAAPCWQLLDVGHIFGPLPPMVYLVEALDLCAGAPGLWAGGGYSAKTVAAQSAAVAIASGQSVWGSFAARRGRVLHLDYEQGERLTRERYQRIASAMLVTPHDIGDRLALVSMPTVYLDQLTAEPRLVDLLRGFDVAFIDSLRAACPNLEENDSGARVVLDMLNRVSNATGCVVIVIHHARKPSKEAPGGSRASIRGSGAIFDACGSVLVFDGPKNEPVRVSHEKARNSGRTVDDFEITVSDVEMDGNPRAGLQVIASALASSSTTTEPSEAQRQLMERLVESLRSEGPAGSRTALVNRVQGKVQAKYAALDQLVLDGRIEVDGKVHRLAVQP